MSIPKNLSEVVSTLRKGKTFEHDKVLTGQWKVIYKDGSELSQYDKNGIEVPYKDIEWDKVENLILESKYATNTYVISDPGEGYKLGLRSRHWFSLSGKRNMAFILICWNSEDKTPNDTNLEWAIYWIPNGKVHHCNLFNCSKVAKYCSDMLYNDVESLIPNLESHV